MKTCLAIIPARGGSKGIKNKNIVNLCGKPLIAYTIAPALQFQSHPQVKKLIVSTDSPQIAEIAQNLGVEVPFLRPVEISNDTAKGIEYVRHALRFFEERQERFDAVMILQPTVPLRTCDDLVQAWELFTKYQEDSLISVYKEEYICDLVTYRKDGDRAIPLDPNHNKAVRRQEHGARYVRNGAVYITDVNYLERTGQLIADTPLCYEMPKSRSINIDTSEDLEIVRQMLGHDRLV